MELCKEQVEEYVIHVEESTSFYTSLRFSLLASPWFPRPLGLALWSVLHVLLVLYMPFMLLAMFSIAFAIAVYVDAFILFFVVLLSYLVTGLFLCPLMSLIVVIVWIWLLISSNVHRWEPGQALASYILTAGGTLTLRAEETNGQTIAAAFLCDLDGDYAPTARLVNHLRLVSIPYWRVNLGNLCREIVPTYDAIVI